MDLAYDHIQEQAIAPENEAEKQEKKQENTLNSDFQEAYKAISSSPWGARLGGFFGNVVKQVTDTRSTAEACDTHIFTGRVCLQARPAGTHGRWGGSN